MPSDAASVKLATIYGDTTKIDSHGQAVWWRLGRMTQRKWWN
ncbi:MAG TPA: hypothetical protein VGO67_14505 [Verrucomicrobiae bacterium]